VARSLRQIARDFREPDDFAIGIAYGVHDNMSPEFRGVLSYAPTFALEASLARGNSERPVRQSFGTVLRGIEMRKVDSQNLRRLIALEPLGTLIPTGHPTRGIQQINRVVGDVLDQQTAACVVHHGAGNEE